MKKGFQHRKSQSSQASLYEAAMKLFRKRGFEATTMREIAEEADVALGLAYRYFKGKEDFIAELYREVAFELDRRSAEIPAGPLGTMLRARLGHKLEILGRDIHLFRDLVPLMLSTRSRLGVLSEHQRPLRQSHLEVLRSLVERSNEKSLFKWDPAEAAYFLYLIELTGTLVFLLRPRLSQSLEGPFQAVEKAVNGLHLIKAIPGVSGILKSVVASFREFIDGES